MTLTESNWGSRSCNTRWPTWMWTGEQVGAHTLTHRRRSSTQHRGGAAGRVVLKCDVTQISLLCIFCSFKCWTCDRCLREWGNSHTLLIVALLTLVFNNFSLKPPSHVQPFPKTFLYFSLGGASEPQQILLEMRTGNSRARKVVWNLVERALLKPENETRASLGRRT